MFNNYNFDSVLHITGNIHSRSCKEKFEWPQFNDTIASSYVLHNFFINVRISGLMQHEIGKRKLSDLIARCSIRFPSSNTSFGGSFLVKKPIFNLFAILPFLRKEAKNMGIVSDVSTKYFLQIWSGAQAVMKLRPAFIAGPPAAHIGNFPHPPSKKNVQLHF